MLKEHIRVRYTGDSMHPTLRSFDLLHVVPYGDRGARRGDIIVFYPPRSNRLVTHRVISADDKGIRTRGDNSVEADEWILRRENIVGYVACAHRGKKRLRLLAGPPGRINGLLLRTLPVSRFVLISLLRPMYARMARAGLFRKLLPGALRPRIVVYRRPAGTELQLAIGRFIIGRHSPGDGRWRIRPPFKLLINESSLPLDASPSGTTAAGSH